MGNEPHLIGVSLSNDRQLGRKVSWKNSDFTEIGILFAYPWREGVPLKGGSGQHLETEFVPIQVIARGDEKLRNDRIAPVGPGLEAKSLFSGEKFGSRGRYPKQLLQICHTIDRAAFAGSRLGQCQRDRMGDGCVTDANRVVTALSARGEL